MQTAGGEVEGLEQFCNQCDNELRDYYTDCTGGSGVAIVDDRKSQL